MSDFVAVLKKTLDGLPNSTPELRQRVYEKARSTIAARLEAMNPPPTAIVVSRQRRALEDAIAEVERSYAKPAPKQEPLDELDHVLNSLNGLKNQPIIAPRPSVVRPTETRSPDPVPSRPVPPLRPAEPAPRQAAPVSQTAPTSWPAPPVAAADRSKPLPVEEDDFDDADGGIVDRGFERDEQPTVAFTHERKTRGSAGKIGIAAVVLAALAGGGFAGWTYRDQVKQTLAAWMPSTGSKVATAPATPPKSAEPAKTVSTEPAPQPAPAPAGQAKLTQKLNADGSEADAGPSDSGATVGEGTSVAAATPPATAQPAPAPTGETPPADAPDVAGAPAGADPAASGTTPSTAAPAPDAPPAEQAQPAGVAVGQKAIFYEERTNSVAGSAEPGSIVWSVVQESPGADLPPEPAIRAEATIPGKDVQLRMTIRRNADKTLPASHIIEMIFLTPPNFDGGGVANVLRVALKGSEQDPGTPLAGIPAKISNGFFLIALSDTPADAAANTRLLRERSWLDVPLVYDSGRRALITMEKGIPGDKVFQDVLKAWGVSSSG